MSDYVSLADTLLVLAVCARAAARSEPNSPLYRQQQAGAVRVLRRIQVRVTELSAGQPAHRKAPRTVRNALPVAERCLEAIQMASSVQVLRNRADAVERTALAVRSLVADLEGEPAQSLHELLVGEGAGSTLPDVFDAFRAIQGTDAVEDQSVDEPAAVAALGARDQDAGAAAE